MTSLGLLWIEVSSRRSSLCRPGDPAAIPKRAEHLLRLGQTGFGKKDARPVFRNDRKCRNRLAFQPHGLRRHPDKRGVRDESGKKPLEVAALIKTGVRVNEYSTGGEPRPKSLQVRKLARAIRQVMHHQKRGHDIEGDLLP